MDVILFFHFLRVFFWLVSLVSIIVLLLDTLLCFVRYLCRPLDTHRETYVFPNLLSVIITVSFSLALFWGLLFVAFGYVISCVSLFVLFLCSAFALPFLSIIVFCKFLCGRSFSFKHLLALFVSDSFLKTFGYIKVSGHMSYATAAKFGDFPIGTLLELRACELCEGSSVSLLGTSSEDQVASNVFSSRLVYVTLYLSRLGALRARRDYLGGVFKVTDSYFAKDYANSRHCVHLVLCFVGPLSVSAGFANRTSEI